MPPWPVTARPCSRLSRKWKTIWPVCTILRRRPRSSKQAVAAAKQSLDLELERYRAGTDSYLNVITTQTIALSDAADRGHDSAAPHDGGRGSSQGLGGGWDASTLPTTDQMRSASLANPDNTKNVAQPVNR